ncbi:MAG TPA: hypothetical protein VF429_01115, partial [Anaerolineae bacterium]
KEVVGNLRYAELDIGQNGHAPHASAGVKRTGEKAVGRKQKAVGRKRMTASKNSKSKFRNPKS